MCGKTILGSSEGEGGKLQGRVHVVRVVCAALELARLKSSPFATQTQHLEQEGEGKQSRCLIRCRVIPAWWSGGGDGRGARREGGKAQ